MSREEDYSISYARKMRAARINECLSNFEKGQNVSSDVADLNTAGLFAKGLVHDNTTLLPSESEVIKLILAMERGTQADLENVTTADGRKLANPLAAFVVEMSGGDAYGFTMPAAPALNSAEAAAEMIEVYEKALNRETDFDTLNYGTADTDITRAVNNTGQSQENLFRGTAPGCNTGPYVSQFIMHDVPLGAQVIQQKYIERTGEYGTTHESYKNIIEGGATAQTTGDAKYIYNGRTLGSMVHNDLIYQNYYYAAAILNGFGAAKHSAFTNPSNSGAFVTNAGIAQIVSAVGAVAANALSATWVHKWRHHMRLRPEEMAARVAKGQGNIHTNLKDSSTVTAIGGEGFLPMIYAEGSPMHPSYPAGHAVIAGACTTILKLFYAEAAWSQSVIHSTDGVTTTAYTGDGAGSLTVHGELNKMAANVSMGRNFAGVHYRSEGDLGMILGEKVAVEYFKDNIARQVESVGTITFVGFDGTTKTV